MINILVAEDDLRILRLISDFLKKDSYKVYKATNGKEALDIFKKEKIINSIKCSITIRTRNIYCTS